MRSAYDPGGGGLDEAGAGAGAGAAFRVVEAPLFDVSLAVLETEFGRGFDAAETDAGFVDAALLSAWLSGFDGRRNCSSAFRFVPAAGLLEVESRDSVLGLRVSDLAIDEETGASG